MLSFVSYCARLFCLSALGGLAAAQSPGPVTVATMRADATASPPPQEGKAPQKPEEVKSILLLHFAMHLFGPLEEPAKEPTQDAGKGTGKDTGREKEKEKEKDKGTEKPAAPKPRPKPRVRIGVTGNDGVVRLAIADLPHKRLDAIELEVVELDRDEVEAGKAAGQCEILYLGDDLARATTTELVATYRDQPLVLVCGHPGFAAAGGDIQLFLDVRTKDGKKGTGRIGFEMNAASLRRKHLRVPAQLMTRSAKGPVD